MRGPLVSMEGIVKRFPGVLALDGCRFELQSGEVHALVGENGAGKSTMMKILTGVYAKDEGRIRYEGQEVEIPNTKAAQEMGISIIHQELNMMPHLTVAQNIFIGREPRRGWFLDEKALHSRTEELFERLHLELDPGSPVSGLTVAKQQMVEIAKALSFESKVLIMDEPTAALTQSEIEELFRIIGQLRSQGVGIVYISHRMEELKRITDRITVMRDGSYIDTVRTESITIDQIIAMMVGRQIQHISKPAVAENRSPVVLAVEGLSRGSQLKDISFHLRRGEILGFAGLMGAGRTEVARAIFGADPIDQGEIRIHGKPVRIRQPHDAVAQGLGYLSEDRKQFGLLTEMDVKTNIAVASYASYRRWGWMDDRGIAETAERYVESLKIKTPGTGQLVKFLSGGNQQKVVMGKWLTRDCDILIFDEPTRGIDVGAKSEIYALLEQLAGDGKSIIMISSELPEILRLSHRILVMCEGRITGELHSKDATQEQIMRLATMRT
ncbi:MULTISPECIES: sugar ABC transporter ATP-binding protein [Paenibacillus]|uniref:sugar ABC transporter ATP-binding protein n=1 Tax=Paenibacillus TaxID=44249 RepID=UPI0022B89568|nr:sugar ABC transporter ATP-binding protein [Paenibacillus caseinilyticus]MCZ8518955.1 sugar ABC transporter ATP-binding protein [Paenibacillus caseinilyticus]